MGCENVVILSWKFFSYTQREDEQLLDDLKEKEDTGN
jgi:hypothetical protein